MPKKTLADIINRVRSSRLGRALCVGNDGLTASERRKYAAHYARAAARPLSTEDGEMIRTWRERARAQHRAAEEDAGMS